MQRTLKFAKYLPCYGWKPIVLTLKETNYKDSWRKNLDPELLDELCDEVKIYRTSSLDIILQGIIGKILHYFSRLLFCPDDQLISWFLFALIEGKRVIKIENVNVIYSTSSPVTNHLVGLLLKKLTKTPWIADFRDPWTANPNYRSISFIHRRFDKFIEGQIYKNADYIITTTGGYREQIISSFPSVEEKKVKCITNGYDQEDFKYTGKLSNDRYNKFFSLVYLSGSSYGDKFLFPLFKGLRILLNRYPEIVPRLRVKLIGEDPSGIKSIQELKIPEEIILFIKYIPQKSIANYLLNSDLQVVLLNNDSFSQCIPQKTFQYLAARKPILAIVPEGETSKVIIKTKSGMVVDPENFEKIAETIYFFYKKKIDNKRQSKAAFCSLEIFERKKLTNNLSTLMDSISIKI